MQSHVDTRSFELLIKTSNCLFSLSSSLKEPVENKEMKTLPLLLLLLVASGACDDVKYISKRNSGRIKRLLIFPKTAFIWLKNLELACIYKSFLWIIDALFV